MNQVEITCFANDLNAPFPSFVCPVCGNSILHVTWIVPGSKVQLQIWHLGHGLCTFWTPNTYKDIWCYGRFSGFLVASVNSGLLTQEWVYHNVFLSFQNPLNLCVKIVQGNWTMELNSDIYSSAIVKLVHECLDQVSEKNNQSVVSSLKTNIWPQR